MSVWIRNLLSGLEDKPVVILHGNVRDKYIDSSNRRVFESLTELLRSLASLIPTSFSQFVWYDTVGGERCQLPDGTPVRSANAPNRPDFAQDMEQLLPPGRILARWLRLLGSSQESYFITVHYLDKLVAYREVYAEAERELLLRLEKLIENILPNHRLVLVSLQDTMIPVELYTASPNVRVLQIPMPSKQERLAYLQRQLGDRHQNLHELIADLTDGLFLSDMDIIAQDVRRCAEISAREVRRIVNKHRLGEQEDHWGALRVSRLRDARRWFVETEGVQGQLEAIRKVQDMLVSARAGLSGGVGSNLSKPRGVLFFAGPTGVGKTLVAKKLAKFLFGTEEAFIRFDMSEFKEAHTVSKLIGSPPGYAGFERGGMLTNAVRERPFSVILFDEIEKAHPKVMDIFLQILDDGRLTDSRGQTVFFTEAVIIFTSNIGAREYDSRGEPTDERAEVTQIRADANLSHEEKQRRVREHFQRCVERFFVAEISRPELLNRIGNNIVPFNYIDSPEVQREIVLSLFKQIREEFEDRWRDWGYRLSFDDTVADWLVQKYSVQIAEFGGRGIVNAVQEEIKNRLAYPVLEAEERGARGVVFRVVVNRDEVEIDEGWG